MKTKQPTRGFGVFEKFLAKKRAKLANKFIPDNVRNGNVLDIGCGSEPFFLLNTKFKNKYGIDPFTNGKFNDITIKKIAVGKDKLPFEDNFFDTIVMLAVFEHIREDKLDFVLKEIKRVLKKNGIFIITTPSPWGHIVLRLMSKFKLVSGEEIEDHKHAFPNKIIKKYLEKAGFVQVAGGYFETYFNMWLIAIK